LPGQPAPAPGCASVDAGSQRFLGLDVGAETIKLVELVREAGVLRWTRRELIEHHKEPGPTLLRTLSSWGWDAAAGAAVSGRFAPQINLPQVPVQQAQTRACRFLLGDEPASVVSIGSHGFSVLELRAHQLEVFRENSRCSQGTGNFLRQLVERFSLTIEAASALAAAADGAAPLSGRCPVILKSDMTHLANKGENRSRILAGLFDAVCENVCVLLKPTVSPSRVVLIGGVSRAPRLQRTLAEFLGNHGMQLVPTPEDSALYFEALGCALIAAERGPAELPSSDRLLLPRRDAHFESLPALSAFLPHVRRLSPPPPAAVETRTGDLILGLDIGSTGSKAVALDTGSRELRWEGYRETLGDPVGAAQALVQQFVTGPLAGQRVLACAVTGSGREIVGSLLTTCYGRDAVYVLNEIAAHAAGAVHFDPRVDTIFEIGGQDAKYIRLSEGRVVDCAMNEACSAGTGSFIAEQGRKFAGIRDVVHLGQEAIAAPGGVSLGQHCSVFMAEIIDEAVSAGVEPRTIFAGLYDSIIQNYLNRVKGNRSVGKVIFCQGMPFSSDALAAAVARQTASEVIVPPNPGTVGALGIALIAIRELAPDRAGALDLPRFLSAKVEGKDTFNCKATTGCGAPGNRCRIDRLRTVVEERRQVFTWGGGCALYDKGTRKKKLPDLAPDPFREREALIQHLISSLAGERPPTSGNRRRTVALSDEFMLKGLFPFFATFLHDLGFELTVVGGCDHATLKRGIQEANVPFCAPMQQFQGLASRMAETGADFVFLPMIRSLPRVDGEPNAVTCPIVQASPDLLRCNLTAAAADRVLSPVVDLGPGNLESQEFLDACRALARRLDARGWRRAHRRAADAQTHFEHECAALGRRALDFCAAHDLVPVVALGRPYTIYNTVLNSNVPALLREQGAVAIPVDCYPIGSAVPVFPDMYWSHGQRILRAAHHIRRTPGVYSLYCSNYSCGPDSFTLHFYSDIMAGKPFAIIETDGHSGDAGTKTRVEAFLYCVAQDRQATATPAPCTDFRRTLGQAVSPLQHRGGNVRMLVPNMGSTSAALAACMSGAGVPAESLPLPDRAALALGRRYTSGKECLPMIVTLGNLLKRLERETDTDTRFIYLMPSTCGPCRFGSYHLLTRLLLERVGWKDRILIWSPIDEGYFDELPGGFGVLLFAGVAASDFLLQALLDVRPGETTPGAAQVIYDRYEKLLLRLLTRQARASMGAAAALWEVTRGTLFGLPRLLRRAAAELASVRGSGARPTVLLVGEIYARLDPFSNDFIIDKLEQRGLRVRLAPASEWLEYSSYSAIQLGHRLNFGARLECSVQQRIGRLLYEACAASLGWTKLRFAAEVLAAAESYVRSDLNGEAVLTVGSPVAEWRHREIDAVVSVGPLECMPNKIAEAQLFHVAEREGLHSLTLPLNGDPISPDTLDNFTFEVLARFRRRGAAEATSAGTTQVR